MAFAQALCIVAVHAFSPTARPVLRLRASSPAVLSVAPSVAAPTSPPAAYTHFPRTWAPLASTFELDPERPTPVRFMDQRYVVWKDNAGVWRVFADVCPHRLAPLSEGRVDRETGTLECAYHGWQFEGEGGACARIPQVPDGGAAACSTGRACARAFPAQLEKQIVWFWPWALDEEGNVPPLPTEATPQHMMQAVKEGSSTYTRDLPYGWDSLLENILDPSHIPFAHHGMQGTRADAIALNVSNVVEIGHKGEHGFRFDFGDRTMGKMRKGTGWFRAPFVCTYGGEFEATAGKMQSSFFNLTVVCIPTAPGWSRGIIYGGSNEARAKAEKAAAALQRGDTETAAAIEAEASRPGDSAEVVQANKPPPKSLVAKLFAAAPTWLVHLGSNRFLDSDLAFLHYQEQELASRRRHKSISEAYFMPAPADKMVVQLRKWIDSYATVMGPLPPPMYERERLFDRYTQHTSHCVHCQRGLEGLRTWRKRTIGGLVVAALLSRFLLARVVAAACVALLPLYALIEQQFKYADYKHYQNH